MRRGESSRRGPARSIAFLPGWVPWTMTDPQTCVALLSLQGVDFRELAVCQRQPGDVMAGFCWFKVARRATMPETISFRLGAVASRNFWCGRYLLAPETNTAQNISGGRQSQICDRGWASGSEEVKLRNRVADDIV